ncbi:hypothetical protein AAG895_09420 [Thauera sp. JM12B12]|uniref:hypothetical protein n=1 Tax=Thauera sp. JM12B12 TaxID=3142262 RepID=UPI0031F3EEC2
MKTVFIRAIEAPVSEKASLLREAIRGASPARFEASITTFGQIPRAPFAYWVSERVRHLFSDLASFASSGRTVKQGLATADDFRFLRLWSEVDPRGASERWFAFAKGGRLSPFYADLYLVVNWARNGLEIQNNLNERGGVRSNVWMLRDTATNYFLRRGLTYPARPHSAGWFAAVPAGCLFGHNGPMAFVERGCELAWLALLNSRVFHFLVQLMMSRGHAGSGQTLTYEVGMIAATPIPLLNPGAANELAERALRSWSLKRRLDTSNETSHAFLLPALLQVHADRLTARAQAWEAVTATTQAELERLAAEIDDHAYRLYELSAEDRKRIEEGFGVSTENVRAEQEEGDANDSDEEIVELDALPMLISLLSWSVGVALGRFDVCLATGERAAPPEPEPFDPLPACAPGMLTGVDGFPLRVHPEGYPLSFPIDGFLVDDPGHPRDLVDAVRAVFEAVFDDANARWHEAAELLGVADLRTWYATQFFELHIKRYSKSRRKAPIYWQLATASGSYSVWIYIHRATSDTLFRLLEADVLGGKLDHEKSKLDSLTQEAGANPSAAARREIELQEIFVGELSALRTEIARVAPLWKPNLDDGVILNFAPLWRLVPQSRSWQAECKKAWDKLVSGEYDWAHLAMHLWPERVVLKCIDDRSLAIAHGLEEVFWHEDASGTWQKQQVDETTVQKLIDERTSATVKAALKDLLSAATPAVSKGRKPKAKSSSPQSAAPKSVPTAARAPTAEAIVDEATLNAVKAAIARVAGGASKADVLTATGLSDTDWNKAVAVLLDRGDVIRSGQKRGTRYHVGTHGEDR